MTMEGEAVIPTTDQFEVTLVSGHKIYVDIEFALLGNHNLSSFVYKGHAACIKTCFWSFAARYCGVCLIEYSTNVDVQRSRMAT